MKTLVTCIFTLLSGIFLALAQPKSEEIIITNNKIELPGTLTYSHKKQPLIIWVHGSGNIDRNGNQQPMISANYIKQFRDEITKRNIAFFSYDKRTTNKNNLKILKKGVLFDDFVADVNSVISYFKKNKQFSKIILIGHSQGALTALLASKNANKYVSLAGTSESIDKTIIKQTTNQNPMGGKLVEEHFKELKETGNIKNVNPLLISLFVKQNLPFLKNWMSYNPIEEIKKITIPVLIINGTKDLQIPKQNAEELHKANPKSKLIIIENMNHMLKNIKKDEDNQRSYFSANFPISKKLIEVIDNFVKNNP